MKKLLLILLLFFPVHGAWGKQIVLDCTLDYESMKVYYYVNLVNNTVSPHMEGLDYTAIITDKIIQWDDPEKALKFFNENAGTNLKYMSSKINRITGELVVTTISLDGKRDVQRGNCTKLPGRKF